MTHVACESKLCSIVRSPMHPCLNNWLAIGCAVVDYTRAANAFSLGITCWHCIRWMNEGLKVYDLIKAILYPIIIKSLSLYLYVYWLHTKIQHHTKQSITSKPCKQKEHNDEKPEIGNTRVAVLGYYITCERTMERESENWYIDTKDALTE